MGRSSARGPVRLAELEARAFHVRPERDRPAVGLGQGSDDAGEPEGDATVVYEELAREVEANHALGGLGASLDDRLAGSLDSFDRRLDGGAV